MKGLREVLSEERVVLDMTVDRLEEVLDLLASLLRGDPAVVDWRALRESVAAAPPGLRTMLREGIWLPHVRTDAVDEILVSVGRWRSAVEVEGIAGPVWLAFLVLGPTRMLAEHCCVVGELARRLSEEGTLEALRDATSEVEILGILRD